ncbi:ribosome small subunit-dependent GTPase A [Clostridium algidicarnis]|uniref:ribosome small subunit-dependent GTPase A n=1 Tax=Clostridium algidicarnis TaxID=37659 RepID=UPI001C0D3CDA|nr:ribosome small subunit-dependent GTPase A [Clostridium algidicarnis]MBU3226547.1 ribosome small subunit-dependent GTPase A [Clostridium algidicarnis]MBU3250542.1 ribosome small subunit-dependent GTPase A [Clostridium algidicarnis]
MDNMNIERYGYTEFYKNQIEGFNIEDKDLIPARIIEVHRNQYTIVTKFGESSAKLKGSLFYNDEQDIIYPSIGDFVLVKHNDQGESIIYKVFERKSKFSRMDSFYEKEQVVATNFDYVFIITSLNKDFNVKRIERYITASFESGGMPILILTKSDLCSDCSDYETKLEKIAIGIPILTVSSITGDGLFELQNYIKPSETIVFLGSSGVGKSSLVNAIAGEEIMKVNHIREDDSKGRHTTTHRQLIMLKNGSMIIDTPGMRELAMWDVSDGLNVAFDDIKELESECKFSNCTHKSEPGCKVKSALESGDLSIKRWENYIKLKKKISFPNGKKVLKTEVNLKRNIKITTNN